MNQNSRVTHQEQLDIANTPAVMVNKFYLSTTPDGVLCKLTFAEVADGNTTSVRSAICVSYEDLVNLRNTMNIVIKQQEDKTKDVNNSVEQATEFLQKMKEENAK